jgi:hypothetical protein
VKQASTSKEPIRRERDALGAAAAPVRLHELRKECRTRTL